MQRQTQRNNVKFISTSSTPLTIIIAKIHTQRDWLVIISYHSRSHRPL